MHRAAEKGTLLANPENMGAREQAGAAMLRP